MTDAFTKGAVVALVAGGTGGHIFPALAVARELADRGLVPVFLTDNRGMKYLENEQNMDVLVLSAADPRGGTAKALLQMPGAVAQASRVLRDVKPATVIGFGGYATLAVMVAARRRGIATCIHEQNAVLGRVNRAMARFVSAMALSYGETALVPARATGKSKFTGNPVRKSFLNVAGVEYTPHESGREFRLLVIGGSQGAAIFSEVVPAALGLLPMSLRQQLVLTQQCRPEMLEETRQICDAADIKAELSPFFDDMDARLTGAHLVIGRSGASTISEVEICARPAVLVPLPVAMDDHQTANAKPLDDDGAAWSVPQSDFTPENLAVLLQELIEHPGILDAASAAMRRRARPDATGRVADLVENLVSKSVSGFVVLKDENEESHHIHSSWTVGGVL